MTVDYKIVVTEDSLPGWDWYSRNKINDAKSKEEEAKIVREEVDNTNSKLRNYRDLDGFQLYLEKEVKECCNQCNEPIEVDHLEEEGGYYCASCGATLVDQEKGKELFDGNSPESEEK